MSSTGRSVAVLGGTFDPVHLGHLESASELRQRLQLDEVRLLPSYRPPLKDTRTAAHHRLAMVELAVQDFPGLTVDARELSREGPSYTVDTLQSLRAELGERVSLSFVMGTDAFNHLEQWHRWQELFDFAHVILLDRAGQPLNAEAVAMHSGLFRLLDSADGLRSSPSGGLLKMALRPWPQSATEIRRRFACGESLAHYLSPAVEAYIRRQGLYVAG